MLAAGYALSTLSHADPRPHPRAPAFSRYKTNVRIAVDDLAGPWPAQKQCLPRRRRVDRMGRIMTNRENAGALGHILRQDQGF
jgi:hypothetical protein